MPALGSLGTPLLEDVMSTPLSLPAPENGLAATASVSTEQVAFWSITGIVAAAATAGFLEVVFHLAG
jgi:hypothetical protein